MKINEFLIKLSDGRNLGYAEYGDRRGKPVFYFHGWPSSRLQAEVTDKSAKKLHLRIISVDRPGYGLSNSKKNRTLLDWPRDVIALADQLGIGKFAVMGVSGDGPYAAACAYKIPDRITKVGIVVGLAPTYGTDLIKGLSVMNKITWGYVTKFPSLSFLPPLVNFFNARYGPYATLLKWMYGAKEDKKILSDRNILKKTRKSYQEAFRNGYKAAALDLKLYTSDWGFDLRNIKSKAFLFYGDVDKNVPIEMGRYYASQIPNSKLIIYPREGHLISRTHIDDILRTLA